MRRATMSVAVALLAISVVLVGAVPVFAEVQNVRVGGDITVRGIWRKNFDLEAGNGNTGTAAEADSESFMMETTGVNVAADLTDNVSAFVRVANQRDLGTSGAATNDIDLSQAYVTLKELFYSPLTVRVGLQPLWFGKGFIVGSNLFALTSPGTGTLTDPNGSIIADEFGDFTAFDAVRATLDFNPVTVDLVAAKLDENTAGSTDDLNLYGINAGYRFSQLNGEVEGYYWQKRDQCTASNACLGLTTLTGHADNTATVINTIGWRGSLDPVTNLHSWGELAYQWGNNNVSGAGTGATTTGSNSQSAWAADLGSNYTLADVAWSPSFGGEWIYYSGNDADQNLAAPTDGWDPMFRGKFDTLIREYQGANNLYATTQRGDTNAFTNQHQFALWAGLKPIKDLSYNNKLTFFVADDSLLPVTGSKRKSYLGTEWDSRLWYAYTEDVSFGLDYGVFWPGNVYRVSSGNTGAVSTSGDNPAQELVSTLKVSF